VGWPELKSLTLLVKTRSTGREIHRTVGYRTGRTPIGRIVSVVLERRRIGIFGGTFDPPHVAHVVLAAAAIHQLDLDVLIVTVAGVPWQKVGSRTISAGNVRLEMAEKAFATVPRVEVSDIELRRSGNSYTVDTLHQLGAEGVDLFLLLGSDAAAGLDTWERYEDVAELATIAVFPRRGHETAEPPSIFDWKLLELPGLEISSTDIRRRAAHGDPIDGLVPPLVHEIVAREALYVPDDRSDQNS
jgi:nicotinate-nucleotide adenylyltransferase